MTDKFHLQHLMLLLKYTGIAFISGAVNHGFFSGQRSLLTALAGIVLFVAGALVEHRQTLRSGGRDGFAATLLWGTVLSIGLGFFTGGLQHFQDSPTRSAWVVPVGFLISAVGLLGQSRGGRSGVPYVAGATLLVTALSVGAWQWLLQHPEWSATPGGHGHSHGHSHGDSHGHSHEASGVAAPGASHGASAGPSHGHSHGHSHGPGQAADHKH